VKHLKVFGNLQLHKKPSVSSIVFLEDDFQSVAKLPHKHTLENPSEGWHHFCSMAVSAVWLIQYRTRGAQPRGWGLY